MSEQNVLGRYRAEQHLQWRMNPSLRISVNSTHLATIGIPALGNCSAIVTWVDRSDIPDRNERRVLLNLGGLDFTAKEFLDWSGRGLSTGDKVLIEIIEGCEPTPPPTRRPLETTEDVEAKKEYVRKLAKELGWFIEETR